MIEKWYAVIIPAAGESKRFGSNKLLFEYKGKAIIEHTLQTYQNYKEGNFNIFVILGYEKKGLKKKINNYSVTFVENPEYKTGGMSSSVKKGLIKLKDLDLTNCQGIFIHPADIPFITIQVILTLIKKKEISSKKIFIPIYKGRRGHPLLIDKSLINLFMQVDEESEGMKGILKKNMRKNIELIDVTNQMILFDIDKREDFFLKNLES
ncbi:MAG: NTP transferase domain-containing protein [Candidatus Thorarchaeota archaeon]